MTDQILKPASSTIKGTGVSLGLAAVGAGTGGLGWTTGAIEASVSIGVSSCEVTVEQVLFLAPTPTI